METTKKELNSINRAAVFVEFMRWIQFLVKEEKVATQKAGKALVYEVSSTYCERFFNLTLDTKGVPVLGVYRSEQTAFFKHLFYRHFFVSEGMDGTQNDYLCIDLDFRLPKSQNSNTSGLGKILLKLPVSKEITTLFNGFDMIYLTYFEIKSRKLNFESRIIQTVKKEKLYASHYTFRE